MQRKIEEEFFKRQNNNSMKQKFFNNKHFSSDKIFDFLMTPSMIKSLSVKVDSARKKIVSKNTTINLNEL